MQLNTAKYCELELGLTICEDTIFMTNETNRNNIISKLSEIEQQENVYIIMAVDTKVRKVGRETINAYNNIRDKI